MEELESLIRAHRFVPNRMRTNLRPKEESRPYGKYKRRYLLQGVLSNTVRSGRIVELCQEMLGPQVTAVCMNRDLCCSRHKDKANAGLSWVCYFGPFEGGALCLADGRRFEGTGVWHGPMDGATVEHWSEPHSGEKLAVVAFAAREKWHAAARGRRTPSATGAARSSTSTRLGACSGAAARCASATARAKNAGQTSGERSCGDFFGGPQQRRWQTQASTLSRPRFWFPGSSGVCKIRRVC